MLSYICCQCKKPFDFDPAKETLILEVSKGKNLMFCSMQCKLAKRHKHKFNASRCENDSIKFGSKAESAYYNRLKFLKQSGEVLFFLRQVPFDLPGNTKYIVDFQVFYADGTVAFIDVKGMSTPMFILKQKQVEELYPIKIEIVKM